jgi:molybdopterin-containing oxidoreductase family iron-sulfur binding subunit
MTDKNDPPGKNSIRSQPYWRSLEAQCKTKGFVDAITREFPRQASQLDNALDRRSFFKLMGASLALAGLSGCTFRPPNETIVPYHRQPEEMIPGKPLFYATAMTLQGYATGLLVESHEGRPTKVEGNLDHPASLGATDIFAQASVLTLYDPDRSRTVMHQGQIRTWSAFLAEFRNSLAVLRKQQGAGIRILTETVTSPTLAAQLRNLLQDFPKAAWHQYEPAARDTVRAGARMAFGDDVDTVYHFEKADVILAIDADFLSSGPASLHDAREFTAKRRIESGRAAMNRLYAVQATPTNTGAMADHRLPVKARDIETFVRNLAAVLVVPLAQAAGAATDTAYANWPAGWIEALARDLEAHRGASIIIVGEGQPPVVHALAHAMNQFLGNVGSTVTYIEPVEAAPVNQLDSLRQLAQAMDTGQVELLLLLGGNPVYSAPVDLKFARCMEKVGMRVHLSLYDDETSALCSWHIPEAHFLESWSDARAYDGTVSIVQPLIAPLYDGKSVHEMLAAFTDKPYRSSYDIVREYWQGKIGTGLANFESSWQQALHDGLIRKTESQPKSVSIKTDWAGPIAVNPIAGKTTEIVFRSDPTVFDGRFANNGWLQELPKPLTKITWDNAAIMSPATAKHYGFSNGLLDAGGEHGGSRVEIVELRYRGRSLRAPVWIVPGHADDSVSVHLGYGRTRAGNVGGSSEHLVGFNAYLLRTSDAPWFGNGLEIVKTGEKYSLACTQEHYGMEGRDLVRSTTLERYRSDPGFARREADDPAHAISLYPDWEYKANAWGMAIDMGSCIGCNACVVACQAENNIPVVGREEVLRAREMHWIRIDRYYQGGESNPETLHQPVLCQHCENAPCELVCPVEATSHSDEGLNEMTYNRCVGTRYCSNNCPYKVRRFNFFEYSDYDTSVLKLQRNPNVTVRSRGVMEKCTYCVQRINAAKIDAENANREVRDGEIVTACQAVCPTQAIVFGNINDPNSHVSKLKAEPRNYGLLAELNTRPRTTYLASVRNPNSEIKAE